ncbi:HPP family protein [Metarhizium rileyi]|uniref:HPP family protein n=1 Tax=Metarhizium rileyi (strain RCEF 4871) TaxID=1649241 RepID=A0A162JSI3_METRR|nr:HPP family protein [Metarhizium rileyi RCEF 4871]TWU71557.1 hypothetical protein ED733_000067 [Metarhizium rileyi]
MPSPHRTWNFDIDWFLNPFVPSPPWRYLPYPVAKWFGYRKTKPKDTGNLMPVFWAFIGVFAAIVTIQAVSKRVPSFEARGAPMIVGSFGAAAVLEFYAIESPLAQPRNAIMGQFISAFVGIAIGKLFQLSQHFVDIQWVGGALACACATALMALTKTVHPPAGATALLAVIDDSLIRIGWFMLPVMLLGCVLMLGVALIVNNLERRFPMYWWTPEDLGKGRSTLLRRHSTELKKDAIDEEKVVDSPAEPAPAVTAEDDSESSDRDQTGGMGVKFSKAHRHAGEVVIRQGEVVVPEHMFLTQEEQQFLETLTYRL